MSSLAAQHPAFGATVRLCRRWAHAHLLSAALPAELVDLLVAHVFTSPAARPPASALLGLLRFLQLLHRHDFTAEPLLLGLEARRPSLPYISPISPTSPLHLTCCSASRRLARLTLALTLTLTLALALARRPSRPRPRPRRAPPSSARAPRRAAAPRCTSPRTSSRRGASRTPPGWPPPTPTTPTRLAAAAAAARALCAPRRGRRPSGRRRCSLVARAALRRRRRACCSTR